MPQSRPDHETVFRVAFAFHGETDFVRRKKISLFSLFTIAFFM